MKQPSVNPPPVNQPPVKPHTVKPHTLIPGTVLSRRTRLATRVLPFVLCAWLAACATTPPPQCPLVVESEPECPLTATPVPGAATPEKPEPVRARYIETTWKELPGWPGDALQSSWSAFRVSCKRLANRDTWKTICADAALLTSASGNDIRGFFEKRFVPWQVNTVTGSQPPVNTGLITGYYEPLLTGGRAAKPGRVPLYAVPEDMLTIEIGDLFPELKGKRVRGRVEGNKVLPYWDRAAIEEGKAKARVLVWVDNAVDAFFLQVQGSGRVALDDGSLMRVGYADQNGHPYKAIGKWLAEQGEMTIDQVSMQNIRAWAEKNPQRLDELLNNNPSYVFFREGESNNDGPIGALNVPLTDGASIAVDRKYIPLGTPVFLVATRPDNGAPLRRLMHAQDTGGAIRGPVRADFFWGFGAEAGALAGRTKQQGQLWILWPKGGKPPKAP